MVMSSKEEFWDDLLESIDTEPVEEQKSVTMKPVDHTKKRNKKVRVTKKTTEIPKYTGNVQVENGFRMIANELSDVMMCANLTGTERSVIDLIHKFTWGYKHQKRQWAEITIEQFRIATRSNEKNTRTIVNRLVDLNIIQRKPSPNDKRKKLYHINKNYNEWRIDRVCYEQLEDLDKEASQCYWE